VAVEEIAEGESPSEGEEEDEEVLEWSGRV